MGWSLKTECEKGKAGLHLPLDEATCFSPTGVLERLLQREGIWGSLERQLGWEETPWQSRDFHPMTSNPRLANSKPAGASQLMAQKDGSQGKGGERLEELESTDPVKGEDAMGLQPIVTMWKASPVSLSLLTSQEKPLEFRFYTKSSEFSYKLHLIVLCWPKEDHVQDAYDANAQNQLRKYGILRKYGMDMCLLPKKLSEGENM